MDRLFTAMAIFIEYPVLAAAVGMVLIALGRRSRRRVVLAVGIFWLLYAVYELGMKQRWLCSGECNIRIDLLLIYPALLIGLLAAGVSLLRGAAGNRPPA
jgi:formate hydrogenlyase subunit 3/multisubunit Na+/H+ antiporter MnhD subunit